MRATARMQHYCTFKELLLVLHRKQSKCPKCFISVYFYLFSSDKGRKCCERDGYARKLPSGILHMGSLLTTRLNEVAVLTGESMVSLGDTLRLDL